MTLGRVGFDPSGTAVPQSVRDGRRRPLRVLTIIAPSNYPNYAADSIFTFNRILFGWVAEADARVEVVAAGPADMPLLGGDIEQHVFDAGSNKYQVRFGFPWSELRSILARVRPEVIFVNMPEQTAAIAILAKDDLGLQSRIVSYVHYVPAVTGFAGDIVWEPSMNGSGHGKVVVGRLLEGLAASDLVLVGSRFGERLLRALAAELLGPAKSLPPIEALPPPIDLSEINGTFHIARSEEPSFVYNHRLYDEYGTHRVFDLLRRIADGSRRFSVLVTNPTGLRTAERRRLNPGLDGNLQRLRELPFVRVHHFPDRRAYFRELRTVWSGIAPFKPNALWSMSVVDVFAVGRPVLALDLAAFREIGIPQNLLVSSDDEFLERFDALLRGEGPFDDEAAYRALADEYRTERVGERFVELLAYAR